ncbi:hypothetical protein GN316_06835 [Xylophilus sp. Kf1]|nr:hypothetical protein [Xylophilus sp. Kf1]
MGSAGCPMRPAQVVPAMCGRLEWLPRLAQVNPERRCAGLQWKPSNHPRGAC